MKPNAVVRYPLISYKMKKRRILQVCNLKHSIKKGILSVLGKMNLLRWGLGEGGEF